MVRIAARLLALALVLAPATLVLPSASSADPLSVRTLVGQVERLAEVRADGTDRVRWELDTGDRVWTLRPGGARLVPGARMEVLGTVSGGEVVALSARVLRRPAQPRLWARASSTRILVMRVFWGASAPAHPTATEAKSRLVTRAGTWFRNVSGGRYSVSGSVTPWLKITKPGSCTSDTNQVMDRALSRARAKGFSPTRYGRYIVYLPCSGGFITGLGSMPGKQVWLFGATDLGTNVHEQGHNLGLAHANLRVCRSNGTRTTWSSSCSVREYSDWSDAMGNGPPAHYSVINKRKLGWLTSSSTVTGDATRTLTPADETSSGLKALGVRTANRTYWVELRSGANEDSGIPARCRGVQVRVAAGGATQVLDLLPGNGTGWNGNQFLYDDDSCTSLPTGSSWVTPEGVRIIAASGGLSGTQVQVDYGFGPAKAPLAPGPVTADTSVPDEVTLHWEKPSDQGSLVTRYEVERPGGAILKVPSLGGDELSTTLDVAPGSHDGLRVRAVNRAGTGPWSTSPDFTVDTVEPSVSISSPLDGATVSGAVPVGFTATSNPTTAAELDSVALEVDGEPLSFQYLEGTSVSDTLTWDSTYDPNGPHTITVTVEDVTGKVSSSTVAVTLANPTVVIDSPQPGATVAGRTTVTFHPTNVGSWAFTSGEVYFNGTATPATKDGSTWTALVDTRTDPNGTYSLAARLTDPVRGDVEKAIQVTSANTMPTISVTAPSGTISTPLQRVAFTTSDATWPWTGFRAQLGTHVVGSAEPGEDLDVDLTDVPSGTYTLKVYGEYGGWSELASAGRSVTLAWPSRSITWGPGAPDNGETVSGSVPVPYTLSAGWPWQQVCLQYDDGFGWADYDCASPGEDLSSSTDWVGNGSHPVRLHTYDSRYHDYYSSQRAWTVSN